MAYFAPYIGDKGIFIPTYEDLLLQMTEDYKSLFGSDAELSAAVPDYQLLSIVSKAIDDAYAMAIQKYNSRIPMYASGADLDLLLPYYGLHRLPGESDAALRERVRLSLKGSSTSTLDDLLAAVRKAKGVRKAAVRVNDTDATDEGGVPAHSIAVVIYGGVLASVAQAIYDHRPPGISTWGTNSGTAVDAAGNEHIEHFSRYSGKMILITIYIKFATEQNSVRNAITEAVSAYMETLDIGEGLDVYRLFGIAQMADRNLHNGFVVTDIQCSIPGLNGVVRDYIPCAWNEIIQAFPGTGISVRFV